MSGDVTHTDFDGADLTRSCTRKKPYPTEAVAKLAVASIMETNLEAHVRVYACRHCGMFHVGRVPVAERVARTEVDDRDEWARRRDHGRPRRGAYGGDGMRRRSIRRASLRGNDD